MADAHWAASARMPSDLLLAEALATAQQASQHGHEQAPQWALLLQHLKLCCQAYRQVLASDVCLVTVCMRLKLSHAVQLTMLYMSLLACKYILHITLLLRLRTRLKLPV